MKTVRIKIRPLSKDQLFTLLKDNDIYINDYAKTFFSHPAFLSDNEEEMEVLIASLRELGFTEMVKLDEIFAMLPKFHLRSCPMSTGIFLRICMKDQEASEDPRLSGIHRSPNKAINVLSKVPKEDETFPKGLYLRNVSGKLWLRGYVCDQEYRWSLDDVFAIAKQ